MAMAIANSLSHADSEEAVGDAFLKIWSSANKYEDLGIDPKYWLRTLMRHALLDKLRTLKRFNLEQSASKTDVDGEFMADDFGSIEGTNFGGFATPVDELETKQANKCFDGCLQALSDAHRISGSQLDGCLRVSPFLTTATALASIGATLGWAQMCRRAQHKRPWQGRAG